MTTITGLKHAVVILSIIVLDQLTKLYVTESELKYFVHNSFPLRTIAVGGALLIFLYFYFIPYVHKVSLSQIALTHFAVVLCLGGGISNYADVLAFGGVVDFIRVPLPFFGASYTNFADLAIFIGVGLAILNIFISSGGTTIVEGKIISES